MMDDIFSLVRDGNALQVRIWLDSTENDLNQGFVFGLVGLLHCSVRFRLVLRGTTVLPRHRGTIFLRYQYRRLYGTI